jgi:hypothetical protein
MEPVFEQSLAQSFLYSSFTRMRMLPAIETNNANDLINVGYDSLNHNRCIPVARLPE